MPLESVAVIVISSFPHPGKVKPQLSPALSTEDAARVHRTFLEHFTKRLASLHPPELVLCFDPPDAGAALYKMLHPHLTRYVAQSAGDRGARIASAVRDFARWYGRLLVLDVDSPDVPDEHIHRVANLLDENEVVVAPTHSGDFWCLGIRHNVDPQWILENIDWSSGVARSVLERAREMDFPAAEADAWEDVKTTDALCRLLARLGTSQNEQDKRLLSALSFLPQGVTS